MVTEVAYFKHDQGFENKEKFNKNNLSFYYTKHSNLDFIVIHKQFINTQIFVLIFFET